MTLTPHEQQVVAQAIWNERYDYEAYNPDAAVLRYRAEDAAARERRDQMMAAVDCSKWTDPDGSRYGLGALRRIVAELGELPAGGPHDTGIGRNEAINRSAFSAGQLVAGGELSGQVARETLEWCGQALGLAPREFKPTIRKGLAAGMLNPRQAGKRDAA